MIDAPGAAATPRRIELRRQTAPPLTFYSAPLKKVNAQYPPPDRAFPGTNGADFAAFNAPHDGREPDLEG
jgi:hypothetical protein